MYDHGAEAFHSLYLVLAATLSTLVCRRTHYLDPPRQMKGGEWVAFGTSCWTRTNDLSINSAPLYRLS